VKKVTKPAAASGGIRQAKESTERKKREQALTAKRSDH